MTIVVLPAPDGPTSATISPASIVASTCASAGVSSPEYRKRHVLERDASAHGGKRRAHRSVARFGAEIEHFEDAAGTHDRLADVAEKGGDPVHRIHQVDEQCPIHEDRSGIEPAAQDLAHREPHDEHDGRDHDRRNDHRLRLNELRELHVRAEEVVVARRETPDLVLFAPERLDDSLTLKHFGEVGGKVGDALLRAVRAGADERLKRETAKVTSGATTISESVSSQSR